MILLYIAIYLYLGLVCLWVIGTLAAVSDFIYVRERWPTKEEFYKAYEAQDWSDCEGIITAAVLGWPVAMFVFLLFLTVIHVTEFIDRVGTENITRPIGKLKILFTFPKHVMAAFLRKADKEEYEV